MTVLSPTIGFNFNPLDRRSDKREDVAFIEHQRHDPASRFLVFNGDVPVLKQGSPQDPWFLDSETTAFGEPLQRIYLGEESNGHGRFALGFSLAPDVSSANSTHGHIDLRALALQGLVAAGTLGIMAEAKSMLDWHRRHSFCANCGSPSRVASSGWQRVCEVCSTRHFPRVDPVVIMLVIDGERCLLGRQRQFAPGMYSALAGFVEPGETTEDAVRREVMEEAHVKCAEVAYFASQPWPFPSSLMIGYFAQASDTDIVVDTAELEDARWFSRAEVAEAMSAVGAASVDGGQGPAFNAPGSQAIAHQLLRWWLERG